MEEQTKSLSMHNTKTAIIIKFIVLFGIAVLAPLLQNQFITGSIVNAVLYLSVFELGLGSAIAIAFFPSLISLGTGLLPMVMAPMTPFIILGNLILILVFNWLKNKNYWLSAISASVLKFGWLFGTSQLVIKYFIKKPVAAKIAAMMSWPQLATALAGSAITYLFIKIFFLKTKDNFEK